MWGARNGYVHFGGLQKGGDRRPSVAAAFTSGKQTVFARDGLRADCPFNDVGVDLDTAVFEKEFQRVPAGHRIADRFGCLGLAGDLCQFPLPDVKKMGDNGCGPLLSEGRTDVGRDCQEFRVRACG